MMRAAGVHALLGVILLAGYGTGLSASSAAPAGKLTLNDSPMPGAAVGERLASLGGTPLDSVAAERDPAGTSHWQLSRPAMHGEIEGFTDRVSAVPGKRVRLMVSTGAAHFRVVAFRFGSYRGGIARRVWGSRFVDGERQHAAQLRPHNMRTVVAPWHSSLVVRTRGWAPGLYVFKLISSSGWQAHVPFVVRSRSASGKVALVAPVATWQAYNDWGGYSLYRGPSGDRRSWAVSFDRPYPAPGAGKLLFGDLPVVVLAERLNIPLAYMTNLDVAKDRRALDGARGYVSMGHDEYWSLSMRRSVMSARDRGTNLAFLGANTMYWRIRLRDSTSGRPNIVGYRSDARLDPLYQRGSPRTTARYRDQPKPKPENSLTGMRYECYPVDAPYVVVSPGWWGFRGTGVERGDQFPHLVWAEADRVYPVKGTPRPLQILSYARYNCGGVGTSTQSVYYTTRSKAGVFDAGTLLWTCALRSHCFEAPITDRATRFARRVTENLLRAFAVGPVGRRHPAHDNVSHFDLPLVNQVPASRLLACYSADMAMANTGCVV